MGTIATAPVNAHKTHQKGVVNSTSKKKLNFSREVRPHPTGVTDSFRRKYFS
jgi:hypothetical protein